MQTADETGFKLSRFSSNCSHLNQHGKKKKEEEAHFHPLIVHFKRTDARIARITSSKTNHYAVKMQLESNAENREKRTSNLPAAALTLQK